MYCLDTNSPYEIFLSPSSADVYCRPMLSARARYTLSPTPADNSVERRYSHQQCNQSSQQRRDLLKGSLPFAEAKLLIEDIDYGGRRHGLRQDVQCHLASSFGEKTIL